MIDIVYVLGNGSPWNNNELLYSLRSIEKYVSEYRNVYIIGECPAYLQNIIHIPFSDIHQEKETRIALKVLRACNEDNISDNFLFMNDDIFILQPFNAGHLPFYHKGLITSEMNMPMLNHGYKQTLLNTYKTLKKESHSVYNFDIHTPVIYNKKLFEIIFNMYNWDIEYSYGVKSIYCNTMGFFGLQLEDCKILKRTDIEILQETIKNKKFFSISDSAIGDSLGQLLNNLFPEKSRYEK